MVESPPFFGGSPPSCILDWLVSGDKDALSGVLLFVPSAIVRRNVGRTVLFPIEHMLSLSQKWSKHNKLPFNHLYVPQMMN